MVRVDSPGYRVDGRVRLVSIDELTVAHRVGRSSAAPRSQVAAEGQERDLENRFTDGSGRPGSGRPGSMCRPHECAQHTPQPPRHRRPCLPCHRQLTLLRARPRLAAAGLKQITRPRTLARLVLDFLPDTSGVQDRPLASRRARGVGSASVGGSAGSGRLLRRVPVEVVTAALRPRARPLEPLRGEVRRGGREVGGEQHRHRQLE